MKYLQTLALLYVIFTVFRLIPPEARIELPSGAGFLLMWLACRGIVETLHDIFGTRSQP